MAETLTEIMEEYERLKGLIKKLENEIEDTQKPKKEKVKLTEEQVKTEITKQFNLLKIRNSVGRLYLTEIIAIYYQYPTELIFGPKLYAVIAKRHHTNCYDVKEHVKHAAETVYQKGDQRMLQDIVKNDTGGKQILSDEEFVIAMVKYLNNNM